MAGHVILLGDSIFDNASYVPGGLPVLDHLRRLLPKSWRATLLAQDGAIVSSVHDQIRRIPNDASHLVLSAGGNDALRIAASLFSADAQTVGDALNRLAEMGRHFAFEYAELLGELKASRLPLAVCTIYDSVPDLDPAEAAGLSVFNDIISRQAFAGGATLIDLRLICDEASDYSAVSPIEPSDSGGLKIAQAIVVAATESAAVRRVVVGRSLGERHG